MTPTKLALGKGELFFAPFVAGTQTPVSFERELGNCPEFTMSREGQPLPHYDSRRGLRVKDDETMLEVTNSASIICDHVIPENLALFFMGALQTVTASSAADQTQTFEDVKAGGVLQLGTSAANPSGVRKVTSVVVKKGVTTLALNTDYVVDLDLARVALVVGGAVVDGDDVVVEYDISASTRQRIITQDQEAQGALRFISHNPRGANTDYFMPWVKLRPAGEIPLITEEYMQIPLSVEALVKGDLSAIYADGRPI